MTVRPPSDGHILKTIFERARESGGERALGFVRDAGGAVRDVSWRELLGLAWGARRALEARGLKPGDRIVLALPTGEAYVAAIFGAMWGGMIPSTFYAPTGPASAAAVASEWRAMLDTFRPQFVVGERMPVEADVPLLGPEALAGDGTPVPEVFDRPDLGGPAYIQFSSGSTGSPKGLALSWSAIRANLLAIARGGPIVPQDLVVSWLPMYHDMGLFGSLLTPLHVGTPAILMDANLFATNPLVWVRLLQDNRATVAVTPPSALQRCLDLLRRRAWPDLDLSSLRQILCGSEPVSPHLVRSFHEVLVPCGVPADALKPVYGLAENTLAVSFPPPNRPARIDRVDREALEAEAFARPAAPQDPSPQEWVSGGIPLDGIQVRVADDADVALPERRVGRILIQSPSLMSATLEDGTLTPRTGDWFDTGDLGYFADGEVYITGRRKDLIIKYGRNYSPDRLEQLVGRVEGVRRVVVFGVFDDARATEKIIVGIEARPDKLADPAARDRLRLEVRGEMQAAGYPVDEVLVLAKGRLPRTTSGKVRRQMCRDLHLRGELRAV